MQLMDNGLVIVQSAVAQFVGGVLWQKMNKRMNSKL